MSTKPINPTLKQKLSELLGPKGYIDDPVEIAPHLEDWRGNNKGFSELLIRPANTKEVASAVALCSEYDQPITAQGGNTGLVTGGIAYGEVILSLQRLNSIRNIDPMNNSMTVDAGCILSNIHTAAENENRYFPLHLGSQGTATIGGLISTNAGGVSVLRYGMTRDLLLGLEVVTADGQIWDGTSGLRKDNTGYDLKHLFCGAEGTLGIVTGATLKLYPVPKSATAWLSVANVDDAVALLANARNLAGDSITSFEFMWQDAVRLTAENVDNTRDPLPGSDPWRILIEVSMHDETQAQTALETILEKAFEDELVSDGVIAQSMSQAEDFWVIRESIPVVKRSVQTTVNFDVSVPVSKVSEFLKQSEHKVSEVLPGVGFVAFGHLGDGNIHYSVTEPRDAEEKRVRENIETIEELVNNTVTRLNGSISAEHGIGLLKRDDLPVHKSELELDMMRSIKRALDPKNIMNPGRIFTV